MCYGVGREICRELSAILTKEPGSFREALQHMYYRPAAIQSYRHGHKGGDYTDMLPFWLAKCRIKVLHIQVQRGWRDWAIHSCCLFYSELSFYGRSLAQVLAICNHACPCDVSCDCLLTCNCVMRAALSICNTRPHQFLMQSLSLFHFSPSLSLSLSLYLWKQLTIWYWSTTCF